MFLFRDQKKYGNNKNSPDSLGINLSMFLFFSFFFFCLEDRWGLDSLEPLALNHWCAHPLQASQHGPEWGHPALGSPRGGLACLLSQREHTDGLFTERASMYL